MVSCGGKWKQGRASSKHDLRNPDFAEARVVETLQFVAVAEFMHSRTVRLFPPLRPVVLTSSFRALASSHGPIIARAGGLRKVLAKTAGLASLTLDRSLARSSSNEMERTNQASRMNLMTCGDSGLQMTDICHWCILNSRVVFTQAARHTAFRRSNLTAASGQATGRVTVVRCCDG